MIIFIIEIIFIGIHHLQLAPSGLLVLGEKVQRAHLAEEVAAQGAPETKLSPIQTD